LHAGDWVLAIGSPFGFDHSATVGLVSAVERPLQGTTAMRFIQTDVPLNPGNSGGPLFNTRGEVVGVNAQIFSLTGGFQGVSFAVPIDAARKAARQILNGGRALHGRIGVTAQDLDATLADALGLASPQGALVVAFQEGSPAADAGLREGDVVTAIDGRPVATWSDLSTTVAMHLPGERLRLQVWRERRVQSVEVTLDDAGGDLPAVEEPSHPDSADAGLRLQAPSAEGTRGLLVEGVSGRAARAGIEPGDVVLAIDGRPADSIAAADAAVGAQAVAVLVQRGTERRYLALPPTRSAAR
jgi:serine protease Do